jgi:formamidopyrimidine-DNA glycosylase
MPELPEVQSVVAALSPALVGAVVESVQVRRRDFIRLNGPALRSDVPGRQIASVSREGKRILMDLAPQGRVVFHLGMSGRLELAPIGNPLTPHTHFLMRFAGEPRELRHRDPRRFGGIWYLPDPRHDGDTSLSRLGPDALGIRVPTLRRLAQRRRTIKALLLDQSLISGMGNIYCDEALFAARIHPAAAAWTLSQRQTKILACSIRKTLRAAIASGGSTLRDYRGPDGQAGAYQSLHRVYGRDGQACLRCGATIERMRIAGRSTHYCPACQRPMA